MKLTESMNWLDIGRYIIQEMKAGVDRDKIEAAFAKKFGWDEGQCFVATDPYYEEKRYASRETKVRRR